MALPDRAASRAGALPRVSARASALLLVLALLSMGLGGCPKERPGDYYVAPPVPFRDAGGRVLPRDGGEGASGPTESDAEVAGGAVTPALEPGPQSRVDPPLGNDDVILPSFVELFRRLSPSVVNIYTQEEVSQRLWSPLAPQVSRGTSLGSGLVLDAEGHIATNAHVVENAAEIRVRFFDETEAPARIVGIDPVRDLALLSVEPSEGHPITPLEPVVQGDSDQLAVGEWVIAIGNPLGLSHTLTKGIVSAVGRTELISSRLAYSDLIQTDAAINEGNSGGPLFNMRGEVVGLATAVSAEGQGIGFAIPWNTVKAALPRLLQGGEVSRSWLGVFARQVALTGELPVGLVTAVVDGSPAARAGVRPGDIITAFDGKPFKSLNTFRLHVATGPTDRNVTMEILRNGRPATLSLRLAESRTRSR